MYVGLYERTGASVCMFIMTICHCSECNTKSIPWFCFNTKLSIVILNCTERIHTYASECMLHVDFVMQIMPLAAACSLYKWQSDQTHTYTLYNCIFWTITSNEPFLFCMSILFWACSFWLHWVLFHYWHMKLHYKLHTYFRQTCGPTIHVLLIAYFISYMYLVVVVDDWQEYLHDKKSA